VYFFFFFKQKTAYEIGVTGVQTCALPIWLYLCWVSKFNSVLIYLTILINVESFKRLLFIMNGIFFINDDEPVGLMK